MFFIQILLPMLTTSLMLLLGKWITFVNTVSKASISFISLVKNYAQITLVNKMANLRVGGGQKLYLIANLGTFIVPKASFNQSYFFHNLYRPGPMKWTSLLLTDIYYSQKIV